MNRLIQKYHLSGVRNPSEDKLNIHGCYLLIVIDMDEVNDMLRD